MKLFRRLRLRAVMLVSLLAMLVIAPASISQQNTGTVVSPIFSLLIGDEPLDVPFSWNNRVVYVDTRLQTTSSSIDTLDLDLTSLPPTFQTNILSVDLMLDGECYSLGGQTLDPLVYQWDVIATDDGHCDISLRVTSEIEGVMQMLMSDKFVSIGSGSGDSSSINNLLADAVDEEIQGQFNLTNVTKLTSNAGGTDNNFPTVYGFFATKGDVELKGILMSSKRKFDARNLTDMDVNAKTAVRFVQGKPVLMGSAVVAGSTSTPPADDDTFAFLAVGRNTTLPGPPVGKEYNINGKNQLNVICTDNKIAGFGRFRVPRSGTRLSTSLIGFTKPVGCPSSGFQGKSAIYSEFKVASTPIGKVLVGRGTAHPLDNGRITTVNAQNPSDPDYALYFLGIPEQLSPLHGVNTLDPGTTVASNVIQLDPFALSKIARINRVQGTIIFSERPDMLDNVEIGDILVGKPTSRLSDGFIREVMGIGTQAGFWFVQTQPAGLNQLFDSGGFSLNRELVLGDIEDEVVPEFVWGTPGDLAAVTPEDPASKAPFMFDFVKEAVAMSGGGLDILPFPPRQLGAIFYDQDGNYSTKNDQVRTSGSFDLDALMNLSFTCKDLVVIGDCANPDFELTFEFIENFNLKAIADVPVPFFADSYTLWEKKFAVIWLGFVPVRPIISLKSQMSGYSDSPIRFGIDQTFSTTNGIKLQNGSWTKIKSKTETIVAAPEPTYEAGDGRTDLKARVAVEGKLKLAGLIGGSVDVGVYTKAIANTPRDPLWSLEAGLDSFGEVELDLLVTDISSGPLQLFDLPFPTVAAAPDSAPEITRIEVGGIELQNGTLGHPSEPQSVFKSTVTDPLVFKFTAFDNEQGADCCTVTLSSSIDGTLASKNTLTANGHYRFSIDDLSDGLHTISVSAKEPGQNNSTVDTRSFQLNINNVIGFDDCDVVDLDLNGLLLREVGDTITISASLPSTPTCDGTNKDITISISPFGTSQTLFTGNGVSVSRNFTFSISALYEIYASVQNDDGVTISNIAYVAVSEPEPEPLSIESDDVIGLINNNYNILTLNEPKDLLPRLIGYLNPPLMAADPLTDYKINTSNWTVDDEARFMNPFVARANHSVSWESTDQNAMIMVSPAGNARIRPDQTGHGWQRITAIETNDDDGRKYRVSDMYYINKPNTLDFGYQQEPISSDASNL